MKYGYLILILIVLAIIAFYLYNRSKAKQATANQIINNYITNPTNSSSSSNNSSSNTSNNNSSNTGTSTAIIKIGDKLYAGQTGANGYKQPIASQTQIFKYFEPNILIGTYLSSENGFTKILTLNPDFGLFDTRLYIQIYALSNQIHK